MEMLGRDALAVLDAAKIEKTNWCGLSMGGMVGMWMGAKAPDRVNRLILSNTSAYFENKQIWNDRIQTVQEKGLSAVVQGTLERWFTNDFRDNHPQKVKAIADMFLATKPEGFIACGQAVRDMDHREIIKSIKAPTMVIAGKQDAGTTVEMAELVRKNIPGASMTLFDAAHIANIECQHDYTDAVIGFLTQK
jgi:3-oxoadipate enol-lactonase